MMKKQLRRICCIVLVFLFFMGLTQMTAAASIQENQWTYKKSHTIVGSTTGALTDYQMRFVVHYGSGTDSGEDVYCDSQCRTDFDDIRFTDSNGNLLDYWIESMTEGEDAIFWVEINSIASNPDATTIWMFVGNSGAQSESNGEDTFIDFCQDTLDGFTIVNNEHYTGVSKTESNGQVSIVDNQIHITIGSTNDRGIWLIGKNPTTEKNVMVEFKNVQLEGDNWECVSIVRSTNHEYGYYAKDEHNWQYVDEGIEHTIGRGENLYSRGNLWGIRRSSEPRYYFYQNGAQLDGSTTIDVIGSNAFVFKVGIWIPYLGSGGTHIYDWIRVRKYVEPEPSHGEWGKWQRTETTGGGGLCLGTLAVSLFAVVSLIAFGISKKKKA